MEASPADEGKTFVGAGASATSSHITAEAGSTQAENRKQVSQL